MTLKASVTTEGPLDMFHTSQGRVCNFTQNSESLTKQTLLISILTFLVLLPFLDIHNKGLYFSTLLNLDSLDDEK